jgi:hypothetical protein
MNRTVQELIHEYIREALTQGRALRDGDSRTANKATRRQETLVRRLAAFGEEGKCAVAMLMEHEDADVRVPAAIDMLGAQTQGAVKVLEEISHSSRWPANISAYTALEMWRDGALKPPRWGADESNPPVVG